MDAECPICSKIFSASILEKHVNSCLDSQEIIPRKRQIDKLPHRKVSQYNESSNETHTKSDAKEKHNDPFALLGLKMDSFDSKRNRAESKTMNSAKEKPTLTSILIAEKKSKGYGSNANAKVEDNDSPYTTNYKSKKRYSNEDLEVPNKKVAFSNSSETVSIINSSSQAETYEKSEELSKNQELLKLKREAKLPLAQRLRPKSLDEYYGQEKLVGENGILRNIIKSDQIPSFILWGVPGVGKTSLARIISNTSSSKFVEVSGADGNTKTLREVFVKAENEKRLTGRKTILFLDEIHRFNKAVQDILLPVIEKGIVTVIGATTENPSFTLNNALLSRMHTFIMEPLSASDIIKVINRGILVINQTRKLVHGLHLIALKKDAIDYISRLSSGDSRVALNILESINAYLSSVKYSRFTKYEEAEKRIQIPDKLGVIKVGLQNLQPLLSTRNYHQMYDRQGESHYDTISAFHKSIRGSDADAAVFYLVKMLTGGEDPLFIARRMIVIASEDIGLRDSSCLPFAIATKDAIEFVGMPEGEIILAHCATKLASALKSTKSYRALRSAQEIFKANPETMSIPIPLHLRNAPTKLMKELGYGETYKYNPNFTYGRVKQTYMPKDLETLKLVEKEHLGETKDPQVGSQEYKKLSSEEKEYQEFKKYRKTKIQNFKRRSINKPSKRIHHSESNNGVPVQALSNMLSKKEIINDHKNLQHTDNARYSYDEFLPKEDQPEYFDGEENDEYSDDPDCKHNFECSYDEFLDRQDQPDYFEDEDNVYNRDQDYPIFFDKQSKF